MYTSMVMLDLQKTFDNFDHQFVDKKVQCLGVSGIKQFKSCLAGRKQSIDVYGTKSFLWSPILFLLFSDDSKLFYWGIYISKMGKELESYSEWFADRKTLISLPELHSFCSKSNTEKLIENHMTI